MKKGLAARAVRSAKWIATGSGMKVVVEMRIDEETPAGERPHYEVTWTRRENKESALKGPALRSFKSPAAAHRYMDGRKEVLERNGFKCVYDRTAKGWEDETKMCGHAEPGYSHRPCTLDRGHEGHHRNGQYEWTNLQGVRRKEVSAAESSVTTEADLPKGTFYNDGDVESVRFADLLKRRKHDAKW